MALRCNSQCVSRCASLVHSLEDKAECLETCNCYKVTRRDDDDDDDDQERKRQYRDYDDEERPRTPKRGNSFFDNGASTTATGSAHISYEYIVYSFVFLGLIVGLALAYNSAKKRKAEAQNELEEPLLA